VAAHPAFAAGEIDTSFIERHRSALFPDAAPASDRILALASLDLMLEQAAETEQCASTSPDPYSPWHQTSGWRLNFDNHHELHFIDGELGVRVVVHYRPGGYVLDLPGGSLFVRGERRAGGDIMADLGGMRVKATVVRNGNALTILDQGRSHLLTRQNPSAVGDEDEVAAGRLTAPMPGKVVAIMAEVGVRVERGTPLLIMEAMKMEHTISAPCGGSVSEFHFSVGSVVNEGAELLLFAADVEPPRP
jgi:3-methylcrotonyl-CoA carboxylase alpha subunit